jgi:tetratricopeptide (TPR) repeat protein
MVPKDPDATGVLVRASLMTGNVAKASEDLATLPPNVAESVGALKLRALIQTASRQPDAARASYARILKTSPNDLESLAALTNFDMASGRPADAAARFETLLKGAKPNVELLLLAARAQEAAKNVDRAEELLEQAIQLDPDRLQPYVSLGQLYGRQRRLEEAIQKFRDVVTRSPKSVAAATMVGMLLEAQGKSADAEKQYEAVLGIDSRAVVASNNLAWIYVASNRKLDEALQLAKTAQQLSPDEPNINDTLGWIYYRKDMAAQAISYLETAAQKIPNGPLQHYHLGMAYVQTGDWVKARTALKKAFSLQSEFEGAEEARKALAMIGA